MYIKHVKQFLPVSIEQAWKFLSNLSNLALITPPSMGFETLSGDDRGIFPGQVIVYNIKPIFGIRMRWVTEITHVIQGRYFVDEQRFGPYAFWHHKHFLREVDGGVEMEDLIHYKLPMGILGRMFHGFLVKPKLDEIFDYRQKVLEETFKPHK